VMGMLADRRDELGRARTQVASRLHRLLLELLPGGAKKFLSARQARALIATVRPRDLAGQTRRRLAVELIAELEAIDKKIKGIDKEFTGLVTEGRSHVRTQPERLGRSPLEWPRCSPGPPLQKVRARQLGTARTCQWCRCTQLNRASRSGVRRVWDPDCGRYRFRSCPREQP